MIQVKTNATKRNPDHRIEVTETQIMNFVIPRFRKMQNNWKEVDAPHILPGLKLHFRKCDDGQTRVSFAEKYEGVANNADWYTIDQLIDLLPF